MVFSNLMDHAILCRASNRSRKKGKFRRIFRDKFAEKSVNLAGIREKQSVKTANFVFFFQEKFARNRSGFALIRHNIRLVVLGRCLHVSQIC